MKAPEPIETTEHRKETARVIDAPEAHRLNTDYFLSAARQSLQMPPTSVRETVTRMSQSRAI